MTMVHTRTIFRLMYGLRCTFHTSCRLWAENVSEKKCPTAGIIVIGDEVLKGQVSDTNSHFIAKNLTNLGVKVEKISVIGDNVNTISEEVRQFSELFTYVITTGGIGPTHDDLTYEGIAQAFGERMEPHPEIVKIIQGLFKDKDISSGAFKFAHIPASAKLTYGYDEDRGRKTLFPSISVKNVHIFPGVPNLMERLFKAVYKELFGKGCKQLFKKDLYISQKEFLITDCLNEVVAKFPKVTFGSYPTYFHSYYDVHITMEAEDPVKVQKACDELRKTLPQGCIVDYDQHPLQDAYEKIRRFAEKKGDPKILTSLQILEKCFKNYKLEELCIYLNSERDSLAVLHLLHACVRRNDLEAHINGFYTHHEAEVFPEVELYMKKLVWRYSVQCEIYKEPLEVAIKKLLSEKPHTRTIIFGCSQSDTKTEDQREVEKVSLLVRDVEWINPLTDWKSHEVWDFIRSLYLPYSVH